MSTPASAPTIPNLFDPATIASPFEAYAGLRSLGPVYDEQNGLWVLSRHADVIEALHHPATFSSTGGYRVLASGRLNSGGSGRPSGALAGAMDSRVLISSDPPDHASLRRLVSRGFTKKSMAQWAVRANALAGELLDELIQRAHDGDADLIRDLAIPLPVTLIAEILGIPPSMMADFRRWSNALIGGLAGGVSTENSEADLVEMFGYFTALTEERRAQPSDDLISNIAVAEPDGQQLEPMEVVMFCILLLVAGNETTTNLLGNMQEAFWTHPDEEALLHTRPDAASAAVEEALRFAGPVQGLFRTASENCAIGGVQIPTGAEILLLFAAANRDPQVFADPDRFWIDRPHSEHVAFGHGIHYCLGAQLARLEVRSVIDAMTSSGVRLHQAGTPVPTMNAVLRGFTSMPVAL